MSYSLVIISVVTWPPSQPIPDEISLTPYPRLGDIITFSVWPFDVFHLRGLRSYISPSSSLEVPEVFEPYHLIKIDHEVQIRLLRDFVWLEFPITSFSPNLGSIFVCQPRVPLSRNFRSPKCQLSIFYFEILTNSMVLSLIFPCSCQLPSFLLMYLLIVGFPFFFLPPLSNCLSSTLLKVFIH